LRIVAFGSTAALVIAGAACAALVEGLTGEVLTIGLMSAGFAGALLLVFLEIGLGEERDRAREEQHRRSLAHRLMHTRARRGVRAWPRRPS
jgi:hypothetical protein